MTWEEEHHRSSGMEVNGRPARRTWDVRRGWDGLWDILRAIDNYWNNKAPNDTLHAEACKSMSLEPHLAMVGWESCSTQSQGPPMPPHRGGKHDHVYKMIAGSPTLDT